MAILGTFMNHRSSAHVRFGECLKIWTVPTPISYGVDQFNRGTQTSELLRNLGFRCFYIKNSWILIGQTFFFFCFWKFCIFRREGQTFSDISPTTDICDILAAQFRRYYIHFYAPLIIEPYPSQYTYNHVYRSLYLDIIILKQDDANS